MNDYWKYRLGGPFCRVLPRALLYWIALRCADRCYANDHEARRAVVSNLRRIFKARSVEPSEEFLEGVARKTFQYFGKYLIDFFRYSSVREKQLRKIVSVEHGEYLDECYQEGKGVLLITAHFGNYEQAGGIVAAMGYPINVVFLPQRSEKIDTMFRNQRERRGIKGIPLGRAASGIIHCLRKGEAVALAADRDFTAKDDRIPFFGELARLPSGPARLAWRIGVPIVPAFLRREVDDTFLFRFYPPLWPRKLGSEAAIRAKIGEVLEKEIGDQPHQWFMFEDFWAGADRARALKI